MFVGMSVWNFGIWDLDFWSFDFGILGFGIWDDLDFGILDLTYTCWAPNGCIYAMFQTPNYRFCILTPFSPISSKLEFCDINCNNWAHGMIITANLQSAPHRDEGQLELLFCIKPALQDFPRTRRFTRISSKKNGTAKLKLCAQCIN